MSEIWFRNPHAYVKELAEVGGQQLIAWDRGMLIKRHIEPVVHAKVYFGAESDFRILAVGPQGTAELDKDHTLENPKAVYPTWEYGEDFNILEEMCANNIADDYDAVLADVPVDERPVPNQEHRVVITNLPNSSLSSSRPFYRHLAELQEEYPEVIIHLHGSYSYKIIFGMGYRSGDFEPRTAAANGRIFLPNGKELPFARAVGYTQWVNLLGMSVTDLKVPRNRCIFNIKSAKHAAEFYNQDIKFKTRGSHFVDPDSPTTVVPTTSASRSRSAMSPVEGDKITCDTCSLAPSCKYYREGAACSMPGSETNPLVKLFKTRDSDRIIDGLGTILGAQAQRLERGMEAEDDMDTLDPEVTKIMNQLFTNGVKLAKLVDPSLTKPMVQINTGKAQQVANASPNQLAAQVVRALEDEGIKRENITPEMFERMLQRMTGVDPAPQAIEGSVVNE